jgi:hypothetical protein
MRVDGGMIVQMLPTNDGSHPTLQNTICSYSLVELNDSIWVLVRAQIDICAPTALLASRQDQGLLLGTSIVSAHAHPGSKPQNEASHSDVQVIRDHNNISRLALGTLCHLKSGRWMSQAVSTFAPLRIPISCPMQDTRIRYILETTDVDITLGQNAFCASHN